MERVNLLPGKREIDEEEQYLEEQRPRGPEGPRVSGGAFGTLCRNIAPALTAHWFLVFVPRPTNDPDIRSKLIVEVHAGIQFAT